MHAAEYNILTDPFHNYEVIETALEPMEIQNHKESTHDRKRSRNVRQGSRSRSRES